jgi:hypothetical protein
MSTSTVPVVQYASIIFFFVLLILMKGIQYKWPNEWRRSLKKTFNHQLNDEYTDTYLSDNLYDKRKKITIRIDLTEYTKSLSIDVKSWSNMVLRFFFYYFLRVRTYLYLLHHCTSMTRTHIQVIINLSREEIDRCSFKALF